MSCLSGMRKAARPPSFAVLRNGPDVAGGKVADVTGGNIADVTGGNIGGVTGGNIARCTRWQHC